MNPIFHLCCKIPVSLTLWTFSRVCFASYKGSLAAGERLFLIGMNVTRFTFPAIEPHDFFRSETTVHPLGAASAHKDMMDVCGPAVVGVELQSVSGCQAQRSAERVMNRQLFAS